MKYTRQQTVPPTRPSCSSSFPRSRRSLSTTRSLSTISSRPTSLGKHSSERKFNPTLSKFKMQVREKTGRFCCSHQPQCHQLRVFLRTVLRLSRHSSEVRWEIRRIWIYKEHAGRIEEISWISVCSWLYFSRAMRCIWEGGSSRSCLLCSPYTGDSSRQREGPHGGRDKTPTTEENFHISKKNFLLSSIWITPRREKEKERRRWRCSSNQNPSKVIKCTLSAEQWSTIKFSIYYFLKFYVEHSTAVMPVFISRLKKGNRIEMKFAYQFLASSN